MLCIFCRIFGINVLSISPADVTRRFKALRQAAWIAFSHTSIPLAWHYYFYLRFIRGCILSLYREYFIFCFYLIPLRFLVNASSSHIWRRHDYMRFNSRPASARFHLFHSKRASQMATVKRHEIWASIQPAEQLVLFSAYCFHIIYRLFFNGD